MAFSDAGEGEHKSGILSMISLLDMKQGAVMHLKLPSGNKCPVGILAPDWWDRRWAKKVHKLSEWALQDALDVALCRNDTWRVAFLLSYNEQKKREGIKEGAVYLDGLINGMDTMGDWGLLAKMISCHNFTSALLLLASGVDVERIPGGHPEKRPLRVALEQNNLKLVEILCQEGAEVYSDDMSRAVSRSLKEVVKRELRKAKVKEEMVSAAEKARIMPLEQDGTDVESDFEEKGQVVQPQKNMTVTEAVWEKMDDYTVSKTVQSSTVRIQTIFNFQAARMTHIHETLADKEDRVVHRHAPVIEYFNAVQNAKEIEEAHGRLVDMGGHPDSQSRDKDYKSPRIVSRRKQP